MKKQTSILLAGALLALPLTLNNAVALEGTVQTASTAKYEKAAEKYIGSRLSDPKGAQYRLMSKPYKVKAQLKRGKDYTCMAVDMRVKAKIGSPGRGLDTYTVLFYNGRAVALERDLRKRVVKLPTEQYLASN